MTNTSDSMTSLTILFSVSISELLLLQCRREISLCWSATILQRCVRRWLSQIRARQVRRVELATRARAARVIQQTWRQFISEKRRYEATYSCLRAKLRQEQLAASIIIAEIQTQTKRVCLPSSGAANPCRTQPTATQSML